MSACAAPAGSPCRTGRGKVAVQYHTARFRLVPQLAKTLNVATPAVRKPGSAWIELPRPADRNAAPAGHVRIGYARASIEVLHMLVNACEIGYMAALNDIRDGDLDAQIHMWRPDLAEQ